MNYTGKEFQQVTGLSERRFQYWKKKGLLKKHYVVERKRPLYTQWETFIISIMVKIVKETPISVMRINLFRESFEALLIKLSYPNMWAKRLHLILIFHTKHRPVPWHPWYDMILCGAPLSLATTKNKHLQYKTIDLEKLWPEE